MIEKELYIPGDLGIHARPASMIVKKAIQFNSKITLIRKNTAADAKSIMSILMLATPGNSTITLRVSGDDERQAFDAIEKLFTSNFHEN